jgi:hypothetical protein
MTRIFTGEIPANPYHDGKDAKLLIEGWNQCKNTILSKCIEVDNKILLKWLQGAEKLDGSLAIFGYPSLEQFIQQETESGQTPGRIS